MLFAAATLPGPVARDASSRSALLAPVAASDPGLSYLSSHGGAAIRIDASPDDESETEALVARSNRLIDLTSTGSAPFRLHSSLFFYDPSGDPRIPPVRGSYVFTWAAANQWREDADLLHLKQIEIANGSTLSIKRNAPYPSFGYWWTRRAIGITRGVAYHFDSYTRVEISQVDGRNVVCARNGGTHGQQELCLDTATALPLVQYDATLHLQILYSDWTEWRNHLYPRTIRAFSGSEPLLRIEIAIITPAPPDSKWLAPPEGSASRDWCANMRPAQLSDAIQNATLPDPITPVTGTTQIVGAIVYGLIGKEGSWLDLSVLESSDFKAAYQMLDNQRQFRNQPATCHGTPVESDTIFRIMPPPR